MTHRPLLWLLLALPCLVLPAAAGTHADTTACAPRRPQLCASFDGQRLWRSADHGSSWQLVRLQDEDDEQVEEPIDRIESVEDNEPASAEEEALEARRDFPDVPSEERDLARAEPDPNAPHDWSERRALCVSDRGEIALGRGHRVSVTQGTAVRSILLPGRISACVFDAEEVLWLSITRGEIRLDPRSSSWTYVKETPVSLESSAAPILARPWRSTARRESQPCPVRAASLLPDVRWQLASWRARRRWMEPGGLAEDHGRDWQVYMGVWLRWGWSSTRGYPCATRVYDHSVAPESPGPSRPPNSRFTGGASWPITLDQWEKDQVRRSIAAALGNGEVR